MPNVSNAIRNSDGSVSATVNGASVVLSASDLAALSNAQRTTTVRPLLVTRASGKQAGDTGTPRYGVWMDPTTKKWHFLDQYKMVIPGTNWHARNLSRSKFKFNAGA